MTNLCSQIVLPLSGGGGETPPQHTAKMAALRAGKKTQRARLRGI